MIEQRRGQLAEALLYDIMIKALAAIAGHDEKNFIDTRMMPAE